MSRPDIRKVIAEYADGRWLTMDEQGDVESHLTPDAVMRWVRRRDERERQRLERTGEGGAVVTTLEWRNIPDGFTLPEAV